MGEIKIRGVDPVIIKKIDEIARAHGMSRNEYLKRCLGKFALVQDAVDLDRHYRELVDILSERLEQCSDIIEANTILLEKLTS